MRTKRGKRIDTFLFPLGDDLEAIVIDWVRSLKEVKLSGHDDPVFPRTGVKTDGDGTFVADGLEPCSAETHDRSARSFGAPSGPLGCPIFRPHSFRDTLAQYTERYSPTIEHYKALSLNLGHEHLATTMSAYANMTPHKQGELVRAVGRQDGVGGETDGKLSTNFCNWFEPQGRRRDRTNDGC